MTNPVVYCGVDTGGAFTDCILISDGRVVRAKAPSTPKDFSLGFFDALESAGSQLGLSLEDLVPRLRHLGYGTKEATNIVVQRNVARTGLLMTEGFGDTLLMMRAIGRVTGVPPEKLMHLSATSKPAPLIPRSLTAEVVERMDSFGDVVVPLDENQCRRAIDRLLALDVEAIAIAFLWSFLNPAHERAALELVREIAPNIYSCCSSALAPRLGEYERTATAAINAYVGPATSDYMERVRLGMDELQARHEPLVLQCSGGAIPISQVAMDAVRTIGSGPAAGVIASADLARRLDIAHVICADVGGTTFDVGLIRDGQAVMTDTSIVSQYRYYAPSVDIESIGAGGGSIAWVDRVSGTLRVGPESAGASPGPAAYGQGGDRPTVTDACLVMGYLNPQSVLAGRVGLDIEAARRAIETVAEPLGMTLERAAAGIVRIAEMHMADLVRKTTIQRGYHPSDFVLFAYGGGGPVHAGSFGAELGVSRVLIPFGESSSLWSAFGAAASDVRRVFEASRVLEAPLVVETLNDMYAGLESNANDWLVAQGFEPPDIRLVRSADVRYKAQIHQVAIPVADGTLDEVAGEALLDDFERAYEALYGVGTGYRAAGIELTAVRISAVGVIAKSDVHAVDHVTPTKEAASRRVWWPEVDAYVDTDVYEGATLTPGVRHDGPAIVEYRDTTLVVHPGQCVLVDAFGNLELELGR